jgi:hypothetical protein
MLKPETEKVWQFLKNQPVLAGFILLGGSALALHLRSPSPTELAEFFRKQRDAFERSAAARAWRDRQGRP